MRKFLFFKNNFYVFVNFQAKALITQLQEQTRQMNDAIAACDTAIESGDASAVSDAILKINPDFRDSQYTKLGLVNGDSTKQVRI